MKSTLKLAYLYPAEMNIYGDRGNVIALQQRCRWRGINLQVEEVHLGHSYDFTQADLVFGGGGQDKGQEPVAMDLQRHSTSLKAAAEAGVPMLLVCGLYQLFGRRFVTAESKELPGIGLFAAETQAGQQRLIGNIIVESEFGQLVGFENHSGETKLDPGQAALGTVTKGFGNDAATKREGAITHNVIGTYLHGPILPKNPQLADYMITAALKHNESDDTTLKPLDDSLERLAKEQAANRPQ